MDLKWFSFVVIVLFHLVHGNAYFTPLRFWGITGAGGDVSILYELNPATGEILDRVGDTGLTHITAISVDPNSCNLFGINSGDFPIDQVKQLLIFNKLTASTAPLLVLPNFFQYPDMEFAPNGDLYAWGQESTLIEIFFNTNRRVLIFPSALDISQVGFTVDKNGVFWVKGSTDLFTSKDGVFWKFVGTLPIDDLSNLLAFKPTDGRMWTAHRESNGTTSLYSFDPNNILNDFRFETAINASLSNFAFEYCNIAPTTNTRTAQSTSFQTKHTQTRESTAALSTSASTSPSSRTSQTSNTKTSQTSNGNVEEKTKPSTPPAKSTDIQLTSFATKLSGFWYHVCALSAVVAFVLY